MHVFKKSKIQKKDKIVQTCIENFDVFWNDDFDMILGRFGEGFGKPKSLIFAIFPRKNGSKK